MYRKKTNNDHKSIELNSNLLTNLAIFHITNYATVTTGRSPVKIRKEIKLCQQTSVRLKRINSSSIYQTNSCILLINIIMISWFLFPMEDKHNCF